MQKATFILLTMAMFSSWGAPSNVVQVARYTNVEPLASSVERDPLTSIVQLVFPKRIQTVNDAFEYLMKRTGYKMAPLENADPLLPILLVSTVPEVHREIGPISIENAMKTLAGEPWEFIVDPVNRYVSFELRPKYRESFETNVALGSSALQQIEGVETIELTPDTRITAKDSNDTRARTNFTPGEDSHLANNLQALDLDSYRKQQESMLNESIALNVRSVEMEKVLKALMPNHWNIDIQVDDPTIRFAKFDLTSQNTRRTILQDFLAPLGLTINFYPAIQPQPLAVVSGK